jgi:hypothetical protein
LTHYLPSLQDLGVKCVLDLQDVEENDLKEMGFSKLEQRRWSRQQATATATALPLLPSTSFQISPTSVLDMPKRSTFLYSGVENHPPAESLNPMAFKAQVQEPPSIIRTRTRRAPPKAASAAPKKVVCKPKPVEKIVSLEEEEEEPEMTEEQMMAALKIIGVCPESFKWSKRQMMSQPCMKCGGAKSKRCNGAGYQCEGGGHWVCNGCLMPAGPSKPVARFD